MNIPTFLRIPRPPDFVVGGDRDPAYLSRWWVIPRNPRFNIYLHRFGQDDRDEALHDHPWWNISVLFGGRYKEHVPGGAVKVRKAWRPWAPWRVVFRHAEAAHRIELFRDSAGRPIETWSLFLTGPVVREWGFHCPKGWLYWRDFVAAEDSGQVGRGCGE